MSEIKVTDQQVDIEKVAKYTFLKEEITDDLGHTITWVYLNHFWVIAPTKKGMEARTFKNDKTATNYWNKCINRMNWTSSSRLCDHLKVAR